MKKIKLEPGQVWRVLDKKWIRVRNILDVYWHLRDGIRLVEFCNLGGTMSRVVTYKAFLRWVRRNKAKIIGIVDSKTEKVRVVK